MKILIWVSIFAFVSCSNMSKNLTKEGTLVMADGRYENESWGDDLEFKRFSWYQELSLIFELMLVEITDDSKFFQWFSISEKRVLESCRKQFLVLSYSLDSKRISQQILWAKAMEQGFENIVVPNFRSHLKLHPDYIPSNLNLYTTRVLCQKDQNQRLSLSFPGYSTIQLIE